MEGAKAGQLVATLGLVTGAIVASPCLLTPLYAVLTGSSPFDSGLLMTKILGTGLISSWSIAWLKRWNGFSSIFYIFALSCFFGWKGIFWLTIVKSPAVKAFVNGFLSANK